MKILVAIANYGDKNLPFLKQIIETYRSMPFDIDIVMLLEKNRDIDDDVELVIGLPKDDPYSLPLAHKPIFVERMHQYDLFIYSEDDMLIKENNIKAFIKATSMLPENYLAGFIRYEYNNEGKITYPDFHGSYHWDPASVLTYEKETFANFTNLHAGAYMVTKKQLKMAIQSGGYLPDPDSYNYGIREQAASDIYIRCNLSKMIGISNIHDFSIHHMPNNYALSNSFSYNEMSDQLSALIDIDNNKRCRHQLFKHSNHITYAIWHKNYYEPIRHDMISLIPDDVNSVLSVGCGWGETERTLKLHGKSVTALPMDCVIGTCAENRGIEVVISDFEAACQALEDRKFDCLFISETLHHLPAPPEILSMISKLIKDDGYVVASVPNFNHISVWRKRYTNDPAFRILKNIKSYKKLGAHFTTLSELKQWLQDSKFKIIEHCYIGIKRYEKVNRITLNKLKRYFAKRIIVLAQKTNS